MLASRMPAGAYLHQLSMLRRRCEQLGLTNLLLRCCRHVSTQVHITASSLGRHIGMTACATITASYTMKELASQSKPEGTPQVTMGLRSHGIKRTLRKQHLLTLG